MTKNVEDIPTTTVTLSMLTIDPVNVRKTARGEEPKFAASIRKRGVYIPMIVRAGAVEGQFNVIDGGERLIALQYLRKDGDKAKGVPVTSEYPVDVKIVEMSDADARAASLALNVIRSTMHPVDEFEAFAAMIKDGATVDEIAAENAMKVPEVRQALSLAAIAPEIRKAWRDGKIDGEAAEAYAQTKDLEHQVRVFTKLKSRAGDEWQITQEIAGEARHQIGPMLKFVGAAEYEKAGHQVNPSLFAEDDRHDPKVDNIPALKAMAAKKLDAECEKLKADGWGWAIPHDEAPNDIYSWRRLPGGTPKKEQKAVAGCTVKIGHDGKLEIERGYLKPGTSIKIEKTAAEKTAARKAGPANPGVISAALSSRMSEALTSAVATVVTNADPDMVLRLAIAGFMCSDSPVCLTHSGMLSHKDDDRADYDFAAELAKLAKVGRPALLKQFTAIIGMAVDVQEHDGGRRLDGTGDDEAPTALVNFVPQKDLQKAIIATFNVDDYFESAPGGLALAAMKDMGVEPLKNEKKAGLAKQAADAAKKVWWLPPQLRTKGYAGPKAKIEPKKAKASKKKRI